MATGGTSRMNTRAANIWRSVGLAAAVAGQLEQRGAAPQMKWSTRPGRAQQRAARSAVCAAELVRPPSRRPRPERGRARGGGRSAADDTRRLRGPEATTARRTHSAEPSASDAHSCARQPPRSSLHSRPRRLASGGNTTLMVKPASTGPGGRGSSTWACVVAARCCRQQHQRRVARQSQEVAEEDEDEEGQAAVRASRRSPAWEEALLCAVVALRETRRFRRTDTQGHVSLTSKENPDPGRGGEQMAAHHA